MALIFVIALGLRLQEITVSPPSLYWEEVALGYDAFSILQTGKDHQGNAWPIVAFPSFGDYKPSLYFYSLVPSVAAFGLTAFAVRLPAALFSSLTVMLISWLAWRWSGSQKVGGWSGLLLAIQPWSWLIGRVGFEVNLAVFLLVLGISFLEVAELKTKMTPRQITRLLGVFALALSVYAYHSSRLWGPLVGVAFFLTSLNWQLIFQQPGQNIRRLFPEWLPAAGLALLLLLPVLLQIQSPIIRQRLQETSRLNEITPVIQAVTAQEALGNPSWGKLLFHRWWFRAMDLAGSYLSHFDPQFLFGYGDENPRHATHYFGMLAPWELLTIGLGALVLFTLWKGSRVGRVRLSLFLLIAPLPAMITLATPHALRALFLAPWLAILSGLGITWLLQEIKNGLAHVGGISPRWAETISMLGVAIGVLGSTFAFWSYLRFIYPHQTQAEWQYGYREMIQAMRQYQLPEENLFVSRELGRPAMYVWFYEKTDPRAVQAETTNAPKDQLEFLHFAEWEFFRGDPGKPGLYAYGAAEQVPAESQMLTEITNLDGQTVWRIVRR